MKDRKLKKELEINFQMFFQQIVMKINEVLYIEYRFQIICGEFGIIIINLGYKKCYLFNVDFMLLNIFYIVFIFQLLYKGFNFYIIIRK